MNEELKTHEIVLPSGSIIHLFVNTRTNLVCLDIISPDQTGGNEFFRRYIDEKVLLAHIESAADLPSVESERDPIILTNSGTIEAYHLRHGLKFPYRNKQNKLYQNFQKQPEPEPECEACHGRGYISSFDTRSEQNEIQRCDLCEKFESDEEARKAYLAWLQEVEHQQEMLDFHMQQADEQEAARADAEAEAAAAEGELEAEQREAEQADHEDGDFPEH